MDNCTKLFRIKKTCLEMLHDRGYLVSQVTCTRSPHSHLLACGASAAVLFLVSHYSVPLLLCTSVLLHFVARPGRRQGSKAHKLSCTDEQEDLDMDKATFREQYSEDPTREDLTTLVPKQDDPTEQVAWRAPCQSLCGAPAGRTLSSVPCAVLCAPFGPCAALCAPIGPCAALCAPLGPNEDAEGGRRVRRCGAAAQIFVFFPEEVKVGVKSIKTFAERMRNESVNRAIMVVIGSLTPFSRQCLAEMAPKYYIEVVRAARRRTAC